MTVVGNVGTIINDATEAYLQFVPQTIPTVDGSTVVTADYFTTLSDPDDGSFSIVLEFGTYDVVVNGRKMFRIGVPDSASTATIDTLIDSDVSFSTQSSTSGWVTATDVVNLRLVPWATSYLWARLTDPEDGSLSEWIWRASSTDTDDGTDTTTVVKPFDRDGSEEGRWHAWR